MCVYIAMYARSRNTYIFISSVERIYHLIKGKQAGCARAILAHLWQWSPARFGGRKSVLHANGDLGVAGCDCWMHQHGHGGTDGRCACAPHLQPASVASPPSLVSVQGRFGVCR